jgi:hypothetical protein
MEYLVSEFDHEERNMLRIAMMMDFDDERSNVGKK